MVELLPCPFCGGEAEMSYYAKEGSPDIAGYYVECTTCSAGGEGFDIQGEMPDRVERTKDKAIAAWNTRPQPSPAQSEVESVALRDAIITAIKQNVWPYVKEVDGWPMSAITGENEAADAILSLGARERV